MTSPVSARLSTVRTFLRVTGGYQAACDALAIFALIAAVALPEPAVALALCWLSLGLALALPLVKVFRHDFTAPGLSSVLVGFNESARLLVTLTAIVLRDLAGAPAWEAFACSILALLPLVERGVRRPVASSGPMAANLPGGDLPLPSIMITNGCSG